MYALGYAVLDFSHHYGFGCVIAFSKVKPDTTFFILCFFLIHLFMLKVS